MDFEGDPDGVADAINTWIADRTGGHIKDLVSGSLVASSRMLLANALYFKASWEVPFAESTTTDRSFTLADGSAVSVPTMSGSVTVSGAQADGFFAADLPYADAGTGLTMTIVLPDEGRFDDVLAGLDWPTLSAAIDAEASCDECEVQLPKFEMEGKPDITSALTTLGMAPAFGGTYDDISPSLTLTAVEQQGFVSVSEKGTEAAAATVAVFDESASEPPFGPIVIDRPFLWLIRESDGGAVLFAGVVTDPR
jgi:serpin B